MSINLKSNEVGVFAVGGLGEVGKNMYGVQYQDEILILDCGVLFPEDDLLGIDYVINDYSYIMENRDKVKAVIISHGHEDHIGGIPYLLRQINVPIYADQLASALLRNKLTEHGLLRDTTLIEYQDDSEFDFGKLSVSFFRVAHSIPEAHAIVVHTPEGAVVFTGDFKFDHTPVGIPAELHKMAKVGSKGVLCLLSDSTNAEVAAPVQSEKVIGQSITNIIQGVSGRIIFATFASNINRLQQVINTAILTDRKIAVFGRSMENGIRIGQELGYIDEKGHDIIIDSREINNIPPEKLIILCTGSQGEPMAALSRIANHTHRQISLQPDDTVIFSSSAIPGNTKSINNLINALSEQGADIVYGKVNNIHTSGHADQTQLLLMLRLMKPQYFMPVHGEYRMQCVHAELAEACDIPKENCFVVKNGDMLALTRESGRIAGSFQAQDVYVDGSGIGDVGNIVLRDRKNLSEDGLVIVTATIDYENKQLISGPDIMSRGFIYMRESGDLINNIQQQLRSAINRGLNESGNNVNNRLIKEVVFDTIKPLLYEKTERSPMILPILLDINKGVRRRTLVNK